MIPNFQVPSTKQLLVFESPRKTDYSTKRLNGKSETILVTAPLNFFTLETPFLEITKLFVFKYYNINSLEVN